MTRKSEDTICRGIARIIKDPLRSRFALLIYEQQRSSHDKIRSAGDLLGEDRIGGEIEQHFIDVTGWAWEWY